MSVLARDFNPLPSHLHSLLPPARKHTAATCSAHPVRAQALEAVPQPAVIRPTPTPRGTSLAACAAASTSGQLQRARHGIPPQAECFGPESHDPSHEPSALPGTHGPCRPRTWARVPYPAATAEARRQLQNGSSFNVLSVSSTPRFLAISKLTAVLGKGDMEEANVALLVLGILILLLGLMCCAFPWILHWGQIRNNNAAQRQFWTPWRSAETRVALNP